VNKHQKLPAGLPPRLPKSTGLTTTISKASVAEIDFGGIVFDQDDAWGFRGHDALPDDACCAANASTFDTGLILSRFIGE
jgi:hypothetical protein